MARVGGCMGSAGVGRSGIGVVSGSSCGRGLSGRSGASGGIPGVGPGTGDGEGPGEGAGGGAGFGCAGSPVLVR